MVTYVPPPRMVTQIHIDATLRVVDLAMIVNDAYNSPLTRTLLSAAVEADELVHLQRAAEQGIAAESPYAPLYEGPGALLPYPPAAVP